MEQNSSLMQSMLVKLLVAAVLAMAAFALFVYGQTTLRTTDNQFGPATITVQGEGEAMAPANIATFSFSVVSEGEDSETASSRAAEIANTILGFLREQGIEERDIKTSGLNLSPKYRYEERICAFDGYCPPGERILDGFEMRQSITVKVRNIDIAGDVISGVAQRNATNISGLQFTIDDEDVLKAKARAAAIADAKAKAEVLAADLGVRLDGILNFNENDGYMPYGYGGAMEMRAMDMAESAVVPEVPVGENEVRSVVNITYRIR